MTPEAVRDLARRGLPAPRRLANGGSRTRGDWSHSRAAIDARTIQHNGERAKYTPIHSQTFMKEP
jgi:hypothetical protein